MLTLSPRLALDAQAVLVGIQGERVVPLNSFFVGPGKSIRERARALIDIAHPKFRDELEKYAREQQWFQG